jgi:protein TonB
MAVAIATVRMRPRTGPALRPARVPFGGLVLSGLAHVALVAIIIVAGHVWRTTQPKAYIVNLVPAVAAVGSPQGQTRTRTPSPPRVEPAPPRPTPAPALPEREPTRAPERPTRPAELPDRARAPRESASLPDRSLPSRAVALPRPGEKELPRVASTPPPPAPSTGPVGRAASPPPPPPPLGLPTGSAQGVGALTLNASDFPFAWYLRQVQSKISREWESQARDGTQPQVVFDIRRDGKISGLAVEKTSGNPLYDQAALRAITDAMPFPPLPDEFKESFLRVHLGFSYSGNRG